MPKLRRMLVAVPIVAMVAALGVAIDAQPASALVPASDQCGGYFYSYNWWSDAAFNEWQQNGTTAYYNYARDQSFFYSNLWNSYC